MRGLRESTPVSLSLAIGLAGVLIVVGVAYGSLKTQVDEHEKKIKPIPQMAQDIAVIRAILEARPAGKK